MHQYNAVLSLGPDHQCSNRRNRPLAPSFYYHTAPGSETPEGILACGPCDRWLVSIPLNGHSECTVGTETFLNSAVIAAVQNCILTPKLLKSTNYTWDLAYELLWFFAELAAQSPRQADTERRTHGPWLCAKFFNGTGREGQIEAPILSLHHKKPALEKKF